jgi:hypothetical protein
MWYLLYCLFFGCDSPESSQSVEQQPQNPEAYHSEWTWGEIFLPLTLTEHLGNGSQEELRIGYFHGGRNILLYRAMDDGAFDRENVNVSFFGRRWHKDKKFYKIWSDAVQFELYRKFAYEGYLFGRTTGPEIVSEIDKGRLDCGMIGESTFVQMVVTENRQWKAIAKLGQDKSEAPGKVMVMKKDIKDVSPEGLKGRTFLSREFGLYD